MVGRRDVVALALALVACLGAGCTQGASNDEQPRPREPSTSLSTPDVERDDSPIGDDEDAPPLPEVAREATLHGAEAFIQHYIELRNYASSTGDVRAFSAASHDCDGCDKYADLYETAYKSGGFFKDSGWKATAIDVLDDGTAVVGLVDIEAPDMRYALTAKDDVSIGTGGLYKFRLELDRTSHGWIVADIREQINAA